MNTDHFIALYDMENYIWTMTMASWTPLIIHDSYELQTSMISDHSKWGFIRFTRSMITHDCYEHWLWAITVHRNSYEFGFWTINDQTHHTWWGGINAMKCWCSYMINTDSVSYYDPYTICCIEGPCSREWAGGGGAGNWATGPLSASGTHPGPLSCSSCCMHLMGRHQAPWFFTTT